MKGSSCLESDVNSSSDEALWPKGCNEDGMPSNAKLALHGLSRSLCAVDTDVVV